MHTFVLPFEQCFERSHTQGKHRGFKRKKLLKEDITTAEIENTT